MARRPHIASPGPSSGVGLVLLFPIEWLLQRSTLFMATIFALWCRCSSS
jgi:hypothetical protein